MPRTVFTSPHNGSLTVKRFIELLQDNIKTGLISADEEICVYNTQEDSVEFDITVSYVSGNLTISPK
jgi:hypothetical protein